jgi:hypothetical protein
LSGLLLAGLLFGSAAAAQGVGGETTTTAPAGGVGIGDDFFFTSAVITTPGEAAPRTFDAYHAAVFAQSWLGEAFFGKPTKQDPPATLPVSRVDLTGTWGNLTGTMSAYYASDGTTAWLSFPDGQTPVNGPLNPPPPSNWFIGSENVIPAFNGTATLIPTVGANEATSIPHAAAPGESRTGSSGSSSSAIWWVLVAGLIIVGVGAFIVFRRRRTPSDDLVSQNA